MLSTAARRGLRARAQRLRPTVIVGAAGLSPPLLAEAARALEDHELIKVRFAEPDREAFRAAASRLAAQLDADLIQTVGRVAVLYRARDDGSSGPP